MRRLVLALGFGLLLAATAAFGQEPGTVPLAPQQELRAQRLGKELRCAVCQGMSIADSPSSTARAQLDKVRELVTQGKSDQEIRDFFVARYGPWILLEPSHEGFAGLVWLLPVLMLLGGGVLIIQVMRRPASPPPQGPEPESAAPPSDADPEDPYLKAVRAELER